jgi:hypothetical protein
MGVNGPGEFSAYRLFELKRKRPGLVLTKVQTAYGIRIDCHVKEGSRVLEACSSDSLSQEGYLRLEAEMPV